MNDDLHRRVRITQTVASVLAFLVVIVVLAGAVAGVIWLWRWALS